MVTTILQRVFPSTVEMIRKNKEGNETFAQTLHRITMIKDTTPYDLLEAKVRELEKENEILKGRV